MSLGYLSKPFGEMSNDQERESSMPAKLQGLGAPGKAGL